MSRIAKNSINISDNVTCKYENGNFYAKGKLGEMTLSVNDLFKCANLSKNTKVCFLDDVYHPLMDNDDIYYINVICKCIIK